MGFPSVYGGVLPLVLVNTAISLALVKNLVDAILRIIGLKRDTEVLEPREQWTQQPYQYQHQQQEFDPADQIHSFVEEVQATLPLIEFKSTDLSDRDDAQCAVCLCDFAAGHLVRKLPNCSHIFHRECLDKWLNHNQTTCPMCRSTLLTEDLARKHKQQEEILAEELAMWLSVYHTSGLARGPWWYRGHGSSLGSWDFH